jgi:hypothetical protein
MAILDDTLAGLVDGLKSDLTDAGLVRVRGGMARGVAWAEASGRSADGAWLELRLHHRPSEHRLQAGLLAYQPMARGARTLVVGEESLSYRYEPIEVVADLGEAVSAWLRRLAFDASAQAMGAASGF